MTDEKFLRPAGFRAPRLGKHNGPDPMGRRENCPDFTSLGPSSSCNVAWRSRDGGRFLLHCSFSERLDHLYNVWTGEVSSHNLTLFPGG
jgi:hypothetical protein